MTIEGKAGSVKWEETDKSTPWSMHNGQSWGKPLARSSWHLCSFITSISWNQWKILHKGFERWCWDRFFRLTAGLGHPIENLLQFSWEVRMQSCGNCSVHMLQDPVINRPCLLLQSVLPHSNLLCRECVYFPLLLKYSFSAYSVFGWQLFPLVLLSISWHSCVRWTEAHLFIITAFLLLPLRTEMDYNMTE